MELKLNNGFRCVVDETKKCNIYYGPNKIGKTQISLALKVYFENLKENVLLFDENIMTNMIVQQNDDKNSFEIMPRIQEYNFHLNNINKAKEKLQVKENLKKICSVNTKKAFVDFPSLTNYIDEDVYTNEVEEKKMVYEENELSMLFKNINKDGFNFFQIIDELTKSEFKVSPDNLKELVKYSIYQIQNEIIKSDYKECPVCYSYITDENLLKIKYSVNNGNIEEKLKKSIVFYLENKYQKIKEIMYELLTSESYSEFKGKIISDINMSIEYYLQKNYDLNIVKEYNKNKVEIQKILKEIKNFRLEENTEAYEYIRLKLLEHSVYKNSDISIIINDGKLKIGNAPVEFENMSKSEQNFFKFLYFEILIYQKNKSSKLNIIVDDPFDSYDDIYVQDSISIIIRLLKENSDKINTFYIFSHSMYVLTLYDKINDNLNIDKFKIWWMDIRNNSSDIILYDDNYRLFEKIEVNPYDYGFALKIADKFNDKYSLIVLASILRNELLMSKLLIRNNSNSEIKNHYKKLDELYLTITESINHIRQDISIKDLNDKINVIYKYNFSENSVENINDIFQMIDSKLKKIEIKVTTGSGKIVDVVENDVSYILIYKYLLGLKIRRIFEKKVSSLIKKDYKEIGELVPELKNDQLKSFYYNYNYIINSFSHSSDRMIPPVLIYSMKYLQDMYDELEKIKEN
jgi:hypothetical protein